MFLVGLSQDPIEARVELAKQLLASAGKSTGEERECYLDLAWDHLLDALAANKEQAHPNMLVELDLDELLLTYGAMVGFDCPELLGF